MKLDPLLNLLYPPKCPFCRRLSPGDSPEICPDCRSALTLLVSVPRMLPTLPLCTVLRYAGPVREALLRYKFSGCGSYAAPFGALLAEQIAIQFGGQFDLITWVPCSRTRRAQRGYDQTELLVRAVCDLYHVAPVRTLHKQRHNRPQSSLPSADARRRNVQHVYRAVQTEQFAGKRVLLIDDIVTTGATLCEAASVLRRAGAAQVLCAALADASLQPEPQSDFDL